MSNHKAECAWCNDICAQMRKYGAHILPLVANEFMPRGWPDRYVSHMLWQGWLEFKHVDTRIDPAQEQVLRKLRTHYLYGAYVVRFPNRIESEKSVLIAEFDGTGRGLLLVLRGLRTGTGQGADGI